MMHDNGLNGQKQRKQSQAASLHKRAGARRTADDRRKKRAEELNAEGNEHFNKGHYVEAIAKYAEAAKVHGLRPTYMANLAATYLRLDQYELAEWAADCALLHSPRFAEARFCRATARKGQGMLKGAELDLQFVLKHYPGILEVRKELSKVEEERKKHGDGQRPEPSYNEEFPPFDAEEWDPPLDSDSEDVRHTGDSRPCKFYNHHGCGKGVLCEHSHAPDDKSVRNDLGENVCLEFLLGSCGLGDKCVYSHSKDYLPQGWWSTPKQVEEAKKLRAALDDLEIGSHILVETLENTTACGRLKKHQDYQEDLKFYSAFRPDVLMSRVKDKAPILSMEVLPKDSSRFVLILCLRAADRFETTHTHLLKALRAEIGVVYATNAVQASTYLEAPELAGVIIGDAAIVSESQSAVIALLVDYVKSGGSVVFGALFPTLISEKQFDDFFTRHFGFEWEYGSFSRANIHKNTGNDIGRRNPSLAPVYNAQAVHIRGITLESAIYRANSQFDKGTSGPNESPAVSARFGRGLVNFLGDVGAEEASSKVILAMLGLLDSPLPIDPAASDAGMDDKFSQARTGKDINGKGPRSPHSGHFVIQLSLFNNEVPDQGIKVHIQAMKTKVGVRIATTEAQAVVLLPSPHLLGIYVTDHALTDRRYKPLLSKLVSYVEGGGCLVFGGMFSSFARFPHIAPLFAQFGLNWKVGDYSKDVLELNHGSNKIADEIAFLPPEVHLKALPLEGVEPHNMIYRQKRTPHACQTPIAFGHTKGGSVGYIGNVSGDACTTPILLAMFNLFNSPGPLKQPDPRKFVIILVHPDIIDGYEQTPLFKQLQGRQVEIIAGEHLSEPRLADLLSSPDLLGALVLDDMFLMPKRKWLSHKVATYVWSGGTVIFCGDFGVIAPPDQFERFMADDLCLPWKLSSVMASPAKLITENEFVQRLPDGVCQESARYEGAFVCGVDGDAVVYSAGLGSGLEDPGYVPVAISAVGKGRVAYFGHEDIGDSDTKLILAMLGAVSPPKFSSGIQLIRPKKEGSKV